jgi:hypothetical protein
VANGAATATYTFPSGVAEGTYTVKASYADAAGNYTPSSATTSVLKAGAASSAISNLIASNPALAATLGPVLNALLALGL